jgi:hypothetical protein
LHENSVEDIGEDSVEHRMSQGFSTVERRAEATVSVKSGFKN